MATYVVVGTNPDYETTVAVGPFRSGKKIDEAWTAMAALGFVAETVEVEPLAAFTTRMVD